MSQQFGAISESQRILNNIPDATPEQHATARRVLVENGDTDLLVYFFGEES